jgi:hypothetical protein
MHRPSARPAARAHHLARSTAQQRADISACFVDQRSRGRAAQWPLEGLPKASAKSGRMAAATRGSIGVLAHRIARRPMGAPAALGEPRFAIRP